MKKATAVLRAMPGDDLPESEKLTLLLMAGWEVDEDNYRYKAPGERMWIKAVSGVNSPFGMSLVSRLFNRHIQEKTRGL